MKTTILVSLFCFVIIGLCGTSPDYAQSSTHTQLAYFSERDSFDVNPPDDVSIQVTGDSLIISWTEVPYAGSYIVEGSDSISSVSFTNVSSEGSFTKTEGTINWTSYIQGFYHFYRIMTVSIEIPDNFVFVERGTLNNGTSDVTVSSFYIDKFEITQSADSLVMGSNPSHGYGVGANYPVNYVSWYYAIEYCNRRSISEGLTPCYTYSTYGTNPDTWPAGWNVNDNNHVNISCSWTANGYRLPTEAEWEFAAMGGNLTHNYTYSGSNTIGLVAWYNCGTSHTVGTLAANELGLYDMSGNVWEWNWDINGTYASGAQNNPHGAVSDARRIRRGGCWFTTYDMCVVSYRNSNDPTYVGDCTGFRICRIVP